MRERNEWGKWISIVGFGWGSSYKYDAKASVCASPHPAEMVHFGPFQRSLLGIFQETHRVAMSPSMVSVTAARTEFKLNSEDKQGVESSGGLKEINIPKCSFRV